ncbi:MAG: hypothetical protein HUU55_12085 [Myxococcales bacterium]|nr:hypothetical protein [Myxococcales bacterium]
MRKIFTTGLILGAGLLFAACGAEPTESLPSEIPNLSTENAVVESALTVVSTGVRIKGPNRCKTDADCKLFACDCTCSAVSNQQTTNCKPTCFNIQDPCSGLEAVCENHMCVTDKADLFCEDFVPPCTSSKPCPDGMECVFNANECNPSFCSCDPTTGAIGCTKDCGGGICKPKPPCADFVPPCTKSKPCPDGFECTFDSTQCNPSFCTCDAATGKVVCTADCGGGVCKPKPFCEDFVPPCSSSKPCPDGLECVIDPAQCNPSFCSCDPATGAILCTDDCGGGMCKPKPFCEDFVPPCTPSKPCPEGFECTFTAGECNPSVCNCDPTTGNISCTDDCNGGICKPKTFCEDFIPPCTSSKPCPSGYQCVMDPTQCNPSACGCDPTTGMIFCTADCGGGVCEPKGLCDDFVPACSLSKPCPDGLECVFNDAVCEPSYCTCDPTTGEITCTDDCKGGQCKPKAYCEDFVPPCTSSKPCPDGLECVFETGACNPSFCTCDAATGAITCTKDCGGGVCKPKPFCEDFIPPCTASKPCPDGFQCIMDPTQCHPSYCTCDATTGQIVCTDDCGGGVCKPKPFCQDFVPPCTASKPCPNGMECVFEAGACNPSFCSCDPNTGATVCTDDCGGGVCKQKTFCEDFVPACSLSKPCPDGMECVFNDAVCEPSYCTCDPTNGKITCTDDCKGGQCKPKTYCEDFIPPCTSSKPCPSGYACMFDPTACHPSYCSCDPTNGKIACTDDCNGGVCKPNPCGCTTDADCVKVTGGCCPCSMGGKEMAVAKQCLNTVPGCPYPPGTFACLAVYMCTDSKAVCQNNQCKLTSGLISTDPITK